MRSHAPSAAWQHLALAGAACLMFGCASAQTVYRCSVDGQATYQSTPCAGAAGRSVAVGSGPSEAETAAARDRAQREQQRAAAIPRLPPPPQAVATAPVMPGLRGKTDCATLIARRDQAMARRNAARGQARQGDGYIAGSAGDIEVGVRNQAALDADRAARAAGC